MKLNIFVAFVGFVASVLNLMEHDWIRAMFQFSAALLNLYIYLKSDAR